MFIYTVYTTILKLNKIFNIKTIVSKTTNFLSVVIKIHGSVPFSQGCSGNF